MPTAKTRWRPLGVLFGLAVVARRSLSGGSK